MLGAISSPSIYSKHNSFPKLKFSSASPFKYSYRVKKTTSHINTSHKFKPRRYIREVLKFFNISKNIKSENWFWIRMLIVANPTSLYPSGMAILG